MQDSVGLGVRGGGGWVGRGAVVRGRVRPADGQRRRPLEERHLPPAADQV